MKVSRNKKQVLAEIKCNFTPLKNNLIEKQQPFTPINLLDPSDLKTPIKNYEIISIEKKYIDHLQEHLSDLFVKLGALNNEKKTFKSIQTQTDISYIQIKISQVQRIHKRKDVNEDIVKCEENKNVLKEKIMNNHIIEPQSRHLRQAKIRPKKLIFGVFFVQISMKCYIKNSCSTKESQNFYLA